MLDKNKDKNGNELERNQIDPKIEIWDKKGHVERSCNEGEMEKRESRDYSKKQEVERSKRSRHEGRSEKVQGMNDKDKDRHNRVTTSHCKGDSSDTKKGSKKDRRVRDSISEWERTTEEKCSKESKREAEKFSYKEESVGNKKSVYKSWAVEGTQKEEDTTRICFEREMESKTERGKGRQKSTIESTRRFESGGESGVRNKEGEIWQRERDSRAKEKKNKEINPPHRGSRPRSKAVLNDGLDI